jgi:hypothetical protein
VGTDTRYYKKNNVRSSDEQGDPQHLGGALLADAVDVHVHGTSLNQPLAISRQPSGKAPGS